MIASQGLTVLVDMQIRERALLIQTDYVAMTVLGRPCWSDGYSPKPAHHLPFSQLMIILK